MGQQGVYEREGEEHDLLVVGNEGSVLGLGICSASFAVWAVRIGRRSARGGSRRLRGPNYQTLTVSIGPRGLYVRTPVSRVARLAIFGQKGVPIRQDA